MNRMTTIGLSLIIAVAVIGFFVGIDDGVPKPEGFYDSPTLLDQDLQTQADHNAKLIAAVTYAEIPHTSMGPTRAWKNEPQSLQRDKYDLFAKVKPTEAEKEASSKRRASRRAFNGAPPIIPHPVENTTDSACYACHSNGMKMAGLKASVMSHQFLGNCVQCHGQMAPEPFRDLDASVESDFVGVPAPKQGKRAYPGAPPTIPHSRWMRSKCTACHGGPNGWAGMESTHPWRTNCTQCHAPSATLDQAITVDGETPMLPPLDVATK